jgi:indolepyruvate decarboxylase
VANTHSTSPTTAIGDFLLRRLREAGITHAFGVAGDYNLEFLQQMEDSRTLSWVGTCNELNASYAADGYARVHGMGALVVTNGVGALSAINGIAGAYSEHVPVICVCGSVPLRSVGRKLLMHHTLAHDGYDDFFRAYAQVTTAQARLTPRNAVAEIDRIIQTAWLQKLPVYLELPSDISYLETGVPTEPLMLAEPSSDTERLESCRNAVAERLTSARSPAILIDLDADRFGVADQIKELAHKLRMPIAAINTSKAVIDDTHPNYLGLYVGEASAPEVRVAVEHSDCLLAIGYRRVDLTSGCFTDAIPASAIHADAYSVDIGDDNYQAVTLKDVLRAVTDAVPPVTDKAMPTRTATGTTTVRSSGGTLTQAAYWAEIQNFVREGDVIIAEDGTSEAGTWALTLPPNCTFICQAIWGSIGYSLGSLLGTLTAAPDRRHLLFIGDGSFQLTAQELSTILRHDHKPIIFLINNGGYTVEKTILGKMSRYNEIADWAYAELPRVFRPDTTAKSFVVKTTGELREALKTPHDSMIFIEAIMDPYDTPPFLVPTGHGMAETDYGPRGPQHRGNLQI